MMNGLSRKSNFKAMREGSWDRSGGNWDLRSIQPGETLVMADLEGPGKIVHWWCTIAAEKIHMFNRMLVLRFYWDGEKTPSVEAPVGDFFCSGHGMESDCISLPITSLNGGKGRNCWFEMPFRKRALLTITNEADKEVRSFYWNIDWQKHESLPEDTVYFHAMYRQEYPTAFGKDYRILEATGCGHYTGTVLSVEKDARPGWFGEGDEKIYVDGESHPSIWGTGTEDYFLTAWSPHVYHSPFSGFSIWQGCNHAGDKTTGYRFHVLDPIPFTTGIIVDIEHAWTVENKEFADFYSSVAYWYQTEPHQTFPKFPGATERRAVRPEEIIYDAHWENAWR
ncbi:MAG: glycoside hydrolase family 172 protein [Clostridia bacterium]